MKFSDGLKFSMGIYFGYKLSKKIEETTNKLYKNVYKRIKRGY